jgi:aryl-phospho-beta-D-glucosidase BglC (GH1 family)
MKPFRFFPFVFVLLTTCCYGQGFLKAKGQHIVNEKEEPVILRGMGLGGWMLQEGYMFRLGSIGQQYRIKAKIRELVGPEKTNQFYQEWLLNHTRKADIDSMAAWGFNSIRLPMHYGLYTLPVEEEPVHDANTWLEKGFAMTDSLLSWCSANKMYLILDLHATPGGQGNDLPISDRDPAKPSLWESKANQEKMIALWRKLAQRYADEPWIGGYDIINEPNWGFEDPADIRGTAEKKNIPLQKLMMDITRAIREVDKRHIIIIEGNGFGNNYNGILPAWDDNMVLSFHKYGNFNTPETITRFLELREKYNIPLWLGESGENSNTWFTEAIRLVESKGIGWAWWQEKKMGINNPLEIKVPEGYNKLLDYWSGKGSKPSETEAWTILQELLKNITIGNTIYHPDVTDAMFRQTISTATKPFKEHVITDNTTIRAVDFDLGRQGYAYFDRDTARYQYTPGVNTTGNRGRMYRNDGVDIEEGREGPFVSSIEDSEWLQYTVLIKNAGNYTVSFTVSAAASDSRLSLLSNDKPVIKELLLPHTEGAQVVSVKDIPFRKGIHSFRLYADKGGFILSSIQFTKQRE